MEEEAKVTKILIDRGNQILNSPRKIVEFTKNPDADKLMNDIENNPHIFVLACVMDRQISAERAWLIPYLISKEIGGHEFKNFLKLDREKIRQIFLEKKLHRFNEEMAKNFYLAIQKIHNEYEDNASNIWKDKPKSATLVRRFLEFNGMGIKIATMTANILAREFKVPLADHICIDISPDIHIKRVFSRLGFVNKEANIEEILYKAREINPLYPGILDLSCWEIGRQWCHPNKPECDLCYMSKVCPKIL